MWSKLGEFVFNVIVSVLPITWPPGYAILIACASNAFHILLFSVIKYGLLGIVGLTSIILLKGFAEWIRKEVPP